MPALSPTRFWRRLRAVFHPEEIAAVATHEGEATRSALVAEAERLHASVEEQSRQTRREVTREVAREVVREADHTRRSIAHEADNTRRTAVGQAELTREAVASVGDIGRQATAEQAELTRQDVCREADFTRRTTVGQTESIRHEVLQLKEHVFDWNLDRFKLAEVEGLLRYFRKKDYLAAIRAGRLVVPRLETSHTVAIASADTQFPKGAKQDNSIHPRFNRKLYELLGNRPGLRVLDLGCAGGGLVRSLLDDGHFAVGLEGCDFPLVNQTGEWNTIPHHLFTCDITHPFRLTNAATGEPLLFDAITAWEVMEHIPDGGLDELMRNLDHHLAPRGYLLFSVATVADEDAASGAIWHVTVKPRAWWLERFRGLGFVAVPSGPLGPGDWLRGSELCRWDWREEDGVGFHIALRRASEV